MNPFLSVSCLGQFRPSVLESAVIAREMTAWLRERGITKAANQGKHLPIAIRAPAEQPSHAYIYDFHPDNCDWLIMWSNGTPTLLSNGYTAQPYDVLLIDDRTVQHKAPPQEPGRWFARLINPILKEVI